MRTRVIHEIVTGSTTAVRLTALVVVVASASLASALSRAPGRRDHDIA